MHSLCRAVGVGPPDRLNEYALRFANHNLLTKSQYLDKVSFLAYVLAHLLLVLISLIVVCFIVV